MLFITTEICLDWCSEIRSSILYTHFWVLILHADFWKSKSCEMNAELLHGILLYLRFLCTGTTLSARVIPLTLV